MHREKIRKEMTNMGTKLDDSLLDSELIFLNVFLVLVLVLV